MTGLRVSVIVPTFRDWDGLARCLRALSSQTVPADTYEILIVNNDPDDPTPGDLPLPPNARLLAEAAKGSYAARNRALAEAKGEILFFTDADCAPDPDWIAAGLARFDADPGVMRLGGQVVLSDAPGAERIAVLHDQVHAFGQDRYIATRGWAATANMVARRAVFDVVGPFDARLMSGGDKNWGRRAEAAGFPIIYAQDVIVRHPPRATLAEIIRKMRRVAGGDLMQKLPERGAWPMRVAWVVLTPLRLLPPSSKLRPILARKDLPLLDRLRLYLIQWRLRLVKHGERGRLLFLGTDPERR
jgi:GT2 family glycosyltransferase